MSDEKLTAGQKWALLAGSIGSTAIGALLVYTGRNEAKYVRYAAYGIGGVQVAGGLLGASKAVRMLALDVRGAIAEANRKLVGQEDK